MWQDIAYGADKNIVCLTVATPDKLLAQNTYQYDGNGQRIEKNELTGKTLYTYDNLNRLAQTESTRNDSPMTSRATCFKMSTILTSMMISAKPVK